MEKQKTALDIVMHPDKDAIMIEEIINLKERLDIFLAECFQKDSTFLQVMRDSLKFSMNKRKNVPAELLAKFVNKLLRSGSKVCTLFFFFTFLILILYIGEF